MAVSSSNHSTSICHFPCPSSVYHLDGLVTVKLEVGEEVLNSKYIVKVNAKAHTAKPGGKLDFQNMN